MLEEIEDKLLTCFSEDEIEDAHLYHEENSLYGSERMPAN